MPQATYPEAARAVPRRSPSKGHRTASLFGLAPSGVCPATTVASGAVRSYRTISPLPATPKTHRRYIFCGTFRRLTPPRRYLALCPVEPGLSSTHRNDGQRLPGQLPRTRIMRPRARAGKCCHIRSYAWMRVRGVTPAPSVTAQAHMHRCAVLR